MSVPGIPIKTKPGSKPSLMNLSVEEENLAVIPFAVLERRVGKRIGKIEINGNKILPDGTKAKVVWQVQGNNELGLPTEQDLDIFVALVVLTFRNDFAKTVTFTGREIARILDRLFPMRTGRIALHRHPSYVSERKTLLMQGAMPDPEARRAQCQEHLQRGGLSAKSAMAYSQAASTAREFHALERCARLLLAMLDEDVLPHVAISIIRSALDAGPTTADASDLLDWCEIAVHVCRQKRTAGQTLRNSAGLLIKSSRISRHPDPPGAGSSVWNWNPPSRTATAVRKKARNASTRRASSDPHPRVRTFPHAPGGDPLPGHAGSQEGRPAQAESGGNCSQQDRFQRIPPDVQEREIDAAIIQEIARKEAPPYEKWRLRKQAQQAVLAFGNTEPSDLTWKTSPDDIIYAQAHRAGSLYSLNPDLAASSKNIRTVSSEYSVGSLPTSDSFFRISGVAVTMWQPMASA